MMKNFLKSISPSLCYFLCLHLFFLMIFFLYNVPLDGIFYWLLLVSFLSLLFLVFQFYRYVKKVKVLENMQTALDCGPICLDRTPALYEKEYITLLNILYQKYRQALDKAEKQRDEMFNYYSLWVHQIKTPIAAMHLNLQNQEQPNLVLENELLKIEQYVEMVLSYLRLESESSDYRFEMVEIDKIIREVVHKYSKLFIQKRLSLEFEKTHLTILSDEKWLSFILEQLLSNALKYTCQGGIRIYAKEEMLFIEDDGIGIYAEDLPRIFEKGYTGYNGHQDKKATGIGLYLVKEVCQRLGIRIEIHSAYRQGTKVSLDLHIEQVEGE